MDEPLTPPRLLHAERGIYFAPVRHHSPACAWALRLMLREIAPRQILIEAPSDFEAVLEVLNDPALKPPVAVVAFREAQDETAVTSYYPLSRHAPEFVALMEAKTLGARVRFIDLASQTRLEAESARVGTSTTEPRSLTAEVSFSASSYVAALQRQTGCRDQNELWDHLFESRIGGGDWRTFFRDVGVYCAAVRATIPQAELAADDTLARERCMTAALHEAAREGGPCVVVTGGLHTPALVAALDDAPVAAGSRQCASSQVYVVRYGFRELDRLNGYAAGLPLPAYYNLLWERVTTSGEAPLDWTQATADLLCSFAGELRRKGSPLVPSLSALSNALEASVRLAVLRGRPGPLRTDLIDAVLSTCVKGEVVGALDPLLGELLEFLRGNALGDVPASAGSPPLVERVRSLAREHGFDLTLAAQDRKRLDIYRSDADLVASRFLHVMTLLNTGFARRVSGPDPMSGTGRELLFETWTASWSPMVEARLIDLARHGDTVEAVALAEIRRMLSDGRQALGRPSAVGAVHLLMRASLAGLQAHIGDLVTAIDEAISTDPEIATVSAALGDLFLLWQARRVLGLIGRPELEHLVATAYRRALELARDIDQVKENRQEDVLRAMATLRQVVAAAAGEASPIDPELFDQRVEASLDATLPPLLAGAMAALAFLSGRLDAAGLAARVAGLAGGARIDPKDNVAAVRGAAAVAPELLSRVPELVRALDAVIAGMDDQQFIAHLPHLRLAFASLNPRETDAVAAIVAERHGIAPSALAARSSLGISEAELLSGLDLERRLAEGLAEDGLAGWTMEGAAP